MRTKSFKKAILVLAIVFISLFVNAQTNYYVSNTGNNSGDGMLATPWLTIQYGLDQLMPGDTLNVIDGTYYEKIHIPLSGIVVRNYLTDHPVIDALGITTQTAIVEINNVSDIIFQGFELKNSIMPDAQGILVDGSCQHITIKECKIHDIHFSSDPNAPANAGTNAQGIIVYGTHPSNESTDINILKNQLYNCRLGYSEGIAINGNVKGFKVSGNTVYNLTNIGIDLAGHEGTCSNQANDQARNGLVKNNIVHNCVSPYATSGGIYVDGGKDILIENNTSYANGYGIEVGCENVGKTTDSITVRDNIFYNNEVCAIAIGGYDYPAGSGKVMHTSVSNNTCFANDYSNSGFGELYLSYSENSIIENNIFYTTSQDILAYAELTQPNLSFNYNIFYAASGAVNLSTDWNGNSYNSYSSFVSGSGTNTNSIFANPLFVAASITSPDFHIQNNSQAINAGNPAFIPATGEVDIDGENRANGIVDCGADEYYLTTGFYKNDFKSKALEVFPNPSRNNITIINSGIKIKKIDIYNESGKQIHSFSVNYESKIQLNISEYPSGLYYIVAYDEELKLSFKQEFIKE